jgi:hypothetical protein
MFDTFSPFLVTNQSVQAVNCCKVTHHFTPETENVDFDDVTKKNMI